MTIAETGGSARTRLERAVRHHDVDCLSAILDDRLQALEARREIDPRYSLRISLGQFIRQDAQVRHREVERNAQKRRSTRPVMDRQRCQHTSAFIEIESVEGDAKRRGIRAQKILACPSRHLQILEGGFEMTGPLGAIPS